MVGTCVVTTASLTILLRRLLPAGRFINPMLNIATVAAGGGSMLFARHGPLVSVLRVQAPIQAQLAIAKADP
jgi:hypothetical protein